MRYAIFSDVHANETAMRAMLADAADARAEKFICLGDVVGYGPDPVQALELVYRKAHVCLAGNHDDAACGRFPVDVFTSVAAAAIERHKRALRSNAIEWLSRLPYIHAESSFACTHGSFVEPENFDYILEPSDAMASWNVRSEQLLFVGHSHKPGIFVLGASGIPHELSADDFILEEGKRYIVNVGSVGYPRSGICRSSYCIYDDQTATVRFRSFPFDLEGYRSKMNGVGIDEAPWIRARAEERSHPEVRAAESFGALRNKFGASFLIGAIIAAFIGIWCMVKFVQTVPDKSDVQMATAEENSETTSVAAATTALGGVIASKRCTVPANGRRIAYGVKLKKGGVPVWVHLRFENGNGESVGDGLWYQNVKSSKRSPNKGIVAPDGATAAFLEVVAAHSNETREVTEMILEPFKEKKQ